MRFYILISILTFSLFSNRTFSQSGNGYTTSTTIVEKADLVGDHEIDTGNFVILKYRHSFDIPGVIDEENERYIFIKLASIDNLVLNKPYSLPDPTIFISTYFWSPWSYSETKKISGTITRTKDLDSIQELNLHLDFINEKGGADTLLYGIYQFKKDSDYFAENHIEYNGEYDNLRIALKEPLKVKKLDLSYRGVWKYQKNITGKQELPQEIGKLKNLEEFNLELQDLKSLPSEFTQLTNLKILDISYNDFESFPTEIFSCEKLDSLNLKLSQITEVPDGISRLKNLKKLNLDDNRLSGFPIAVTNLPELRELSINNGNIKTIPKEIGKLTNLEKLDFSNFWNYDRKNICNNLENLAQLTNLKELNLEWTKIKSLPPEFSQLEKLEVLNIKYNDFKSFPEVINQIPNLKLLIICYEEFDKKTMKELKKQNKKYKVQVESF
jgi:Leucine-rich repeat (LRR) protein